VVISGPDCLLAGRLLFPQLRNKESKTNFKLKILLVFYKLNNKFGTVDREKEYFTLISCESLCLKILAKDRMARKKAILVSTFLRKLVHFGLDFEEAQALITKQLRSFLFLFFHKKCTAK
jgi:hypothetical protein